MRHLSSLSLVVPVFNEEDTIALFLDSVAPIVRKLGIPTEIVFVDDGSRDRTVDVIKLAIDTHPEVRLVSLTRNFGKEAALTAGLAHTTGAAVIPIDCDLQDPPTLIPLMVEQWAAGYDVVLAQRRTRATDSWVKRLTAQAFYALMRRLTTINIPENVGDFRLMDRRAVDALLSYPERARFMKGLAASVGFRQCTLQFDRCPRAAGTTKWNYWRLWNFALDGITSFSTLPLRIWTYIGAAVSVISFAYALWIVFKTLAWGVVTPGYATILTVLLMLGGLQLIGLGIIGEYIGRIVQETKQRPLYLVDATMGFPPVSAPTTPSTLRPVRVVGGV
jgi:glycosyltransferase involved in cell wall biosynthesis